MKNYDAMLIGLVSAVWGVFALIYWWLGMFVSAVTWGAGAVVFTAFTLVLASARRRALRDAPRIVRPKHIDIVLIGAVSVVWTAFALIYWALGLFISAVTWGAGAWLFVLLTVGLAVARYRAERL
jgi:hypothetical protein